MINENTILLFSDGYIDRCKNINHHLDKSFITIDDEALLRLNLENGFIPILIFKYIVYVYDPIFSKEILNLLFTN